MNHDDLANYSHTEVNALKAQLTALRERAERAETSFANLQVIVKRGEALEAQVTALQARLDIEARDAGLYKSTLTRSARLLNCEEEMVNIAVTALQAQASDMEKSILDLSHPNLKLLLEERNLAQAQAAKLAEALERCITAIDAGFGKAQREHIKQQARDALQSQKTQP